MRKAGTAADSIWLGIYGAVMSPMQSGRPVLIHIASCRHDVPARDGRAMSSWNFHTLFAPLTLKPQSLKKPEPGKDWQTALVLLQRLLFPRETRDIGASGPWGLVSRLQGPRDFTSHGFKNPECHPLP